MEIQKADIVRSLAGRDKERLFIVLETDDKFALLADGKIRRLEKPKRKKIKHLSFAGTSESIAAKKLRQDKKVTNNEIRRALAEFASEPNGVEGGM